MLTQIKETLGRHLVNLPGWRTSRKIVVFESDDWGSIRSSPKQNHSDFLMVFPTAKDNPYLLYDTLASSEDLEALYSVLSSFKDSNNKNPVFTFNTVVANPRFDLIEKSGFKKYFYEPFTQTLEQYYPGKDVFQLWRQGMGSGLIYPQFHGREHVNVPIWLSLLKRSEPDVLNAFRFSTWSTPNNRDDLTGIKLQATLDWKEIQPIDYQNGFISEGLDLFENIFGFRSRTMIANNFILDNNLHPIILENEVSCLQGMRYQVLPYAKRGKHKYIWRSLGAEDKHGIKFLVRNCTFEPSQTKANFDDVGNCIKEIQAAFLWKKPAIIATHRLNYIGELDENNRKNNLKKLNSLLNIICTRWPGVEFITSSQLFELIEN